jgi:hypothetical protein
MFKRISLALALICCPVLGVFAGQQEIRPANLANTVLLRGVGIKHVGFVGDAILNNGSVAAEEQYHQKHSDEFPTVETAYDQNQVNRTKELLRAFWNERGIKVEVSSELKPVPSRIRYADLEFIVRKLR